MHVTLKFLGGVEARLLERVHAAVRDRLPRRDAIGLHAHGLGAFPSLRRPRVVWAGLDDGGSLTTVAKVIDSALEPFGFAPEARRFTPHVTLGRVNSPRGWAPLEAAIKERIDEDFGNSVVRDVIIYRSTLQRGGSVYTPLWTISLTENRGTA
jgi:2'-5' RNA ligase